VILLLAFNDVKQLCKLIRYEIFCKRHQTLTRFKTLETQGESKKETNCSFQSQKRIGTIFAR